MHKLNSLDKGPDPLGSDRCGSSGPGRGLDRDFSSAGISDDQWIHPQPRARDLRRPISCSRL